MLENANCFNLENSLCKVQSGHCPRVLLEYVHTPVVTTEVWSSLQALLVFLLFVSLTNLLFKSIFEKLSHLNTQVLTKQKRSFSLERKAVVKVR